MVYVCTLVVTIQSNGRRRECYDLHLLIPQKALDSLHLCGRNLPSSKASDDAVKPV